MILRALLCVLLLAVPAFADSRYDKFFREATIYHFRFRVQPSWLKATAIAESALRSNARSSVGAAGLMQFMPPTWAWIAPEPYKTLGPLDPEAAIFVGAKYLRYLWDQFPTSTTDPRKRLSNAAYNSGPGSISRAQKRCAADLACLPNYWDAPNVETHLVTALRFQTETRGYVARIRRLERTAAAAIL